MNGQIERRKRRRRWPLVLLMLLLLGALVWYFWPRPPQEISAQALRDIPLLQQGDYYEPVAVFSGEPKSVATSGCGAVCMAMSISYLTGQRVSPQDLFQWACDNSFYYGYGLGHEALTAMAEQYQLTAQWIGNDQLGKVRASLEKGYPVVAHMGPGTFTKGGHYILLRGVEGEEGVLVNDPQSVELSRTVHNIKDIQKELRREKSFLILKP